MSTIRFFLALWLCKTLRFGIRTLGRGGTTLPGKVAYKLCPDILTPLSEGVCVVILTGTNGKTTASRMVEQTLLCSGRDCAANRSGANLMSGIVTELAENATIFGRKRLKYAVIECDEAAFAVVTKYIRPRVIAVTNIFRDQLDRYGEVTHTLSLIRTGIENSPEATVCLNADDPLTSSLSDAVCGRVLYFGLNAGSQGAATGASDAPRCLHCGAKYEYDFRTFAQLGGFRCPQCGFSRKTPDVAVSRVIERAADSTTAELTLAGESLTLEVPLPGDYNLYNAAAAMCAAIALGIDADSAAHGIASSHCGFGRMERFDLGDTPVRMILVKNPAGCDRALDYLAEVNEPHKTVLCLNDNIADGTDISWIWDADFEGLDFENGGTFAVSGTRLEDMALRLKYAGAQEEQVQKIGSEDELVRYIEHSPLPVYILPTYTAMLSLRDRLGSLCGRERFWG